jgi:hypothetical protein
MLFLLHFSLPTAAADCFLFFNGNADGADPPRRILIHADLITVYCLPFFSLLTAAAYFSFYELSTLLTFNFFDTFLAFC